MLRVLARGDNNVRGAADDAVAVRTGRRVTVVGARTRTVTAASTRTYLVPDVDGDGQSEVAAVRGREFEHRFVVQPSRGGRAVVVQRARWDVIDVEGRVGEDWLVVAADPDGRAYLLGYAPRSGRWRWRVALPAEAIEPEAETEVDDVSVDGERVRVAMFVATGDVASTVVDVEVRDGTARVVKRERRPAWVRTTADRIDPSWRLEERGEPPSESGLSGGRVEITRPGGDRTTLVEVDDDLPVASLLRGGADCAVVFLQPREGRGHLLAVDAGGDVLARVTLSHAGLGTLSIVGRRLLVSRREGKQVVVRLVRTDERIATCG